MQWSMLSFDVKCLVMAHVLVDNQCDGWEYRLNRDIHSYALVSHEFFHMLKSPIMWTMVKAYVRPPLFKFKLGSPEIDQGWNEYVIEKFSACYRLIDGHRTINEFQNVITANDYLITMTQPGYAVIYYRLFDNNSIIYSGECPRISSAVNTSIGLLLCDQVYDTVYKLFEGKIRMLMQSTGTITYKGLTVSDHHLLLWEDLMMCKLTYVKIDTSDVISTGTEKEVHRYLKDNRSYFYFPSTDKYIIRNKERRRSIVMDSFIILDDCVYDLSGREILRGRENIACLAMTRRKDGNGYYVHYMND